MNCPKCNSEKLHRSRRRGLYERLVLQRKYFAPYRCEACGVRFIVSTVEKSASVRKGSSRSAKKRIKHKLKYIALLILLGLAVSWLTLRLTSNNSPTPPPEQTANQ
jgi:hypothetical protein